MKDPHLVLLEEPLHLLIRFCELVFDNELTPPMTDLKKQQTCDEAVDAPPGQA